MSVPYCWPAPHSPAPPPTHPPDCPSSRPPSPFALLPLQEGFEQSLIEAINGRAANILEDGTVTLSNVTVEEYMQGVLGASDGTGTGTRGGAGSADVGLAMAGAGGAAPEQLCAVCGAGPQPGRKLKKCGGCRQVRSSGGVVGGPGGANSRVQQEARTSSGSISRRSACLPACLRCGTVQKSTSGSTGGVGTAANAPGHLAEARAAPPQML